MPDSSRAFLSRPRTMHDEIRTGPPYGHALSIPHCREAQTKTTLSFQNLEAALPPGIPAGRRSSSRSSVRSFPSLPFYEGEAPQAYACGGGDASPINCMPELATIGSIPAANGRCAWRDQGSFFPPWKNDRVRCGCNLNRVWPRIIMGTPLRKQSNERSVPTHPSESKATRGVSPHPRPRG